MIAFMGISGAGKTTLLKSLPLRPSYHVVTASELIKRQINRRASFTISSEQMRLSATDDMQTLLIEALKVERSTAKYPIILDCHAVIDKGDYLDPIPIHVFKHIGVSQIIHLVIEPTEILARRNNDKSRTRPEIKVQQLADHQNTSISHARAISAALHADYVETDGSAFTELLESIRSS